MSYSINDAVIEIVGAIVGTIPVFRFQIISNS